ncbi:MAG: carbon-nitrogen hydrolase family protein [Marinagarivorans sp.]
MPATAVTVAAVQMVSEPNLANNLNKAAELLAEASALGAECAVLPENFALFGQAGSAAQGLRESQGQGEILAFLAEQAKRLNLWLIGGTIPLACNQQGLWAQEHKSFASCCVFSPQGEQVSRYDKMHLFDAGVQDAVGSYRESAQFEPGSAAGWFEGPGGKWGLAVCYDLRFPEYFRLLSQAGCHFLAVPSAFVYTTGQAHWEVLLRARAIENQCFVVAANQGGHHCSRRRTWGHSMIVNPWGDVVAVLPEGEGVVTARLELGELQTLRERMPVLSHRRIN